MLITNENYNPEKKKSTPDFVEIWRINLHLNQIEIKYETVSSKAFQNI